MENLTREQFKKKYGWVDYDHFTPEEKAKADEPYVYKDRRKSGLFSNWGIFLMLLFAAVVIYTGVASGSIVLAAILAFAWVFFVLVWGLRSLS